MQINLTPKEKTALEILHKETNHGKNRDKIKAILLLDKGFSVTEVSEILLLSENTIRHYENCFKKQGSKGGMSWLIANYKTYEGKLTIEEEQEVINYVENNIISDSKELIQFIELRFEKIYSLSGIVSLLKRLGFVYKSTVLIPSKYDKTAQKEFKETYEPKIEAEEKNEVTMFMDGVHPQHNTSCSKAWIKKGEEVRVKSNTGRSRININGVYNPLSQEILFHETKTINADAIIEFLEEIAGLYSKIKRK